MTEPDSATQIRLSAFAFLEEQCQLQGETLSHDSLEKGFEFSGEKIPLISPRGIHIPAVFRRANLPEIPLSFNTTPPKPGRRRPYDDGWREDGLLRYHYFQTDPSHRDNVGMRLAMQWRVPLIYFEGLVAGRYRAYWPIYLLRDEVEHHLFLGTPEKQMLLSRASTDSDARGAELVREYSTTQTKKLEHQRTFRGRVLLAYDYSCAICRLKHDELLDAAHILPDSNPLGEPWVSNGLTLCKIHHAAFDCDIIGIRLDRIVEIRPDVLAEDDGPMLDHGLKGCHGKPLLVLPNAPHWQPSAVYLAERYEAFKKVAS